MTGMDDAIKQAARRIYGAMHRDTDPYSVPLERAAEKAALALADAGILAPTPLRVNQAAAEATARYGVRTEEADEFRAFCAGAMWAVDRAGGDGSNQ